jgi:hypothetical protein
MQAVIRSYSGEGAEELIDILDKHQAELQPLMGSIQGLVSYTLARSAGGGFSETVCQDKAGMEESMLKAKEWINQNAGGTTAGTPQVTDGSVITHFN